MDITTELVARLKTGIHKRQMRSSRFTDMILVVAPHVEISGFLYFAKIKYHESNIMTFVTFPHELT